MGEANANYNKEMQALLAAALNDSYPLPIGEEMLSPNQQMQQIAPTYASPVVSGGNQLMSNAQIQLNNIRDATPKPTTHKSPQGRVNRNKHGSQPYDPMGPIREQDLYMPIANVMRIMRKALPPHAKVADDAKEMVQESVSEFINFVTSEANANCREEHRKTITAEDIILAMAKLGFEQYVEPLLTYLDRYRDSEKLTVPPKSNGENTGPGCKSSPVGLLQPTSNGLPPISMMHPHFAMMFGAPGNSGYYPNGPVPSAGTKNDAQASAVAPAVPGNGQGLFLGGGSPSGGDGGAGPSGPSSTAGMSLYDYLAQYK